jgi:hypothetical protein
MRHQRWNEKILNRKWKPRRKQNWIKNGSKFPTTVSWVGIISVMPCGQHFSLERCKQCRAGIHQTLSSPFQECFCHATVYACIHIYVDSGIIYVQYSVQCIQKKIFLKSREVNKQILQPSLVSKDSPADNSKLSFKIRTCVKSKITKNNNNSAIYVYSLQVIPSLLVIICPT